MTNLNGFLVLHKEKNVGSTDCVRLVKKLLNEKKVGHSGTLDPLATGVLVVCVGKATKTIEYLQKQQKTYIAEIKFGSQTNTLDSEGDVINTSDKLVNSDDLINVIKEFKGNITQVPPMYSALKHNGKRLYEYAREGITIEREAREVSIYDIQLINFNEEEQTASILTTVSAGTYIRTLIDDIGLKLGSFAHMTALRRTSCSGFSIEDSIRINIETENLENSIIPLNNISLNMNKINICDEDTIIKLKNGMTTLILDELEDGKYMVFNENNILGVGNVFNSQKGVMLKLDKHLY